MRSRFMRRFHAWLSRRSVWRFLARLLPTVLGILALALGIGVGAAIFTIVSEVEPVV